MAKNSQVLAADTRRSVLEQSRRAHVGHIGSCLSIVDLVAVLLADRLHRDGPEEERDTFLLSKGHAALTLFAALHHLGRLSEGQLETFCGDDTLLAVHPEHELEGVDFSAGSLGQGLSIGLGVALGARQRGRGKRTVVLMSDAETNEGSVWEAVMCAAQHRLGRLVVVLDANAQQALGYTRDVMARPATAPPWAAFGWEVREVDGHDHEALREALDLDRPADGPPLLVLARTTFGYGVSYMADEIHWHYWPMDAEQYAQALADIEAVDGA